MKTKTSETTTAVTCLRYANLFISTRSFSISLSLTTRCLPFNCISTGRCAAYDVTGKRKGRIIKRYIEETKALAIRARCAHEKEVEDKHRAMIYSAATDDEIKRAREGLVVAGDVNPGAGITEAEAPKAM